MFVDPHVHRKIVRLDTGQCVEEIRADYEPNNVRRIPVDCPDELLLPEGIAVDEDGNPLLIEESETVAPSNNLKEVVNASKKKKLKKKVRRALPSGTRD